MSQRGRERWGNRGRKSRDIVVGREREKWWNGKGIKVKREAEVGDR